MALFQSDEEDNNQKVIPEVAEESEDSDADLFDGQEQTEEFKAFAFEPQKKEIKGED